MFVAKNSEEKTITKYNNINNNNNNNSSITDNSVIVKVEGESNNSVVV